MEVCKISDVIRDARIRSGMTQEAPETPHIEEILMIFPCF